MFIILFLPTSSIKSIHYFAERSTVLLKGPALIESFIILHKSTEISGHRPAIPHMLKIFEGKCLKLSLSMAHALGNRQ